MKLELFSRMAIDLNELDDYDWLFADTEFTRLQLPQESTALWLQRVRLLSLGIAALDPHGPARFYAKRRLERRLVSRCARFVKSEVLPHLDAVPANLCFSRERQLITALQRLLSARRLTTGKRSLIVVDWAGDAHLLEPLLGPAVAIVVATPPTPMRWAMADYFSDRRPRHNALVDAMALCEAFLSFNALKKLDS